MHTAILLAAVLIAWQQMPPRDVVKRPSGVASLSGRITEDGTGRPLARMRVELRGRGLAGTMQSGIDTITDADGRYSFDGVPPGDYFLSAGPGEYRASHLGKNFTLEDAPLGVPPLRLQPGETRRNVDVVLARAFAIEGRIVNEFGEPLSEVWVVAEPIKATATSIRSLLSDDRGHFRLYGLGAGTWRVCAEARNQGFERVTDATILQTRLAKTCVPGPGGAPIVIKDGDVAGVVLQLQRVRAFTLSGRIVRESGEVPQRASVSIERIEREGFSRGSSNFAVEYEAGRFVARGVPPGEYAIRAMIADDGPFPRPEPREGGIVRVTVDSGDVGNILLMMSRGADLSGRLSIDGEPVPSLRGVRIQIGRLPYDTGPIPFIGTPSVALNDDLTFALSGLHGPVMLGVTGLPRDWVVKEIRYGDTDIADVATEFPRGSPAVHVVVTNRTARVTVRPVDESGALAPKGVAVLLPVDETRHRGGMRTSLGGPVAPGPLPARDGTAQIGPVRPGDYLLFALSSADMSRAFRTPALLKSLADKAQRLTLKAGDHPRLDVRVVALPEEP